MKITSKQKALLVEKYIAITKKLIVELLPHYDHLHVTIGDMAYNNIKADAALLNIPLDKDDQDYEGFSTEKFFNQFDKLIFDAQEEAFKTVLKELKSKPKRISIT